MSYIRNIKGWIASVVALVVFVVAKIFIAGGENQQYIECRGEKFSTIYSITYKSPINFCDSIENLLDRLDKSLSPFNQSSILSSINKNDTTVVIDKWLKDVLIKSQQISKATNYAFDPTLSPLINAWGFGYKSQEFPTKEQIDSLKKLVGINKVMVTEQGKVVKENSEITLNFSAIAKGYIVDAVSSYLSDRGVTDYLVNIGGEIACRGENPKGEKWRVGIDKPEETNLGGDIHSVLALSGKSLATSGNYRKFKVADNKKVWHIIDPRTGYPTTARVLSATVIANDCATADAYATALMVLGVEEGMSIIEEDETLEAMLIAPGDTSQYKVYYSKGFRKYLK